MATHARQLMALFFAAGAASRRVEITPAAQTARAAGAFGQRENLLGS